MQANLSYRSRARRTSSGANPKDNVGPTSEVAALSVASKHDGTICMLVGHLSDWWYLGTLIIQSVSSVSTIVGERLEMRLNKRQLGLHLHLLSG